MGTCLDPYPTDNDAHLKYHERNRQAGRMSGQITLRVRYQRLATDWFDYVFVPPDELQGLVEEAGWVVADTTEPDPIYLAVLKPA